MTDWMSYKGEGPWVCTPVTKITYDEGDKTTSVANPVWVVDQDGITDRRKHDPCGYWPRLPYTTPPEEVIPMFEVYHEMLPGEAAQPSYQFDDWVWGSETFILFDSSEFDSVEKVEFEVIFRNQVAVDIELCVIDTDDVVCASVTLPANTMGLVSDFELKRLRVDFDASGSTAGDNIFGLKVFVPTCDWPANGVPCNITNARLVVTHQPGATKTRLQIPLFASSYVYALETFNTVDPYSDPAPYDYPIGYKVAAPIGTSPLPDAWVNDWSYVAYSSGELTAIWKHRTGEIGDVSKVIFSVAARAHYEGVTTDKTWSQTLTTGPDNFNMMLYKSPTTSSSAACTTADPLGWVDENQIHTDTCNSTVLTPISGSLIHLTDSENPNDPWEIIVNPVFPQGSYKVYFGGDPYSAGWGHYAAYWSMTVPANTVVASTMRAYSNVNFIQYYELSYMVTPVTIEDLEVGLWNITDGHIVTNSIMTWTVNEGFVRKYAEISPVDLPVECEYEMRVKQPGAINISGGWWEAEIMDAQLLISLDPIEDLTVWYRCYHRYDGTRDGWVPDNTWGDDAWSDVEYGSNCIQHSCYFPIPTGSRAYFEVTCTPDINPAAADQLEAQKQYLEDFGAEPEGMLTGLDGIERSH